MSRILIGGLLLGLAAPGLAAPSSPPDSHIEHLDKPMYTPFIERYMLDELKQLRVDLGGQKAELTEKIAQSQLRTVDRALNYASDMVLYFFYLIAGATSLLVLVGWSSFRDIKERMQALANQEISALVGKYEQRLQTIEQELKLKSQSIEENREQLARHQEVQALWLRAAQETNPSSRIQLYDQILGLREHDVEAMSYKADAVLELSEPQWAANLCRQALSIDPDNVHALYQLACALTALEQPEEAIKHLTEVVTLSDSYRADIAQDPALEPLRGYPAFEALVLTES
ncbi:MAG: tetratricopeptide repeat protein [Methylococcales bacterium]|nr:tetratricopeptide repeat protein [Methylococcales bacterium]